MYRRAYQSIKGQISSELLWVIRALLFLAVIAVLIGIFRERAADQTGAIAGALKGGLT